MDLLEWLTCCGSTSPTMAVNKYKVEKSNSCSGHVARCLSWYAVYS